MCVCVCGGGGGGGGGHIVGASARTPGSAETPHTHVRASEFEASLLSRWGLGRRLSAR